VKLPAIPSEQILVPVQTTEGIPIFEADNMITTKMDDTVKAFEATTFEMSKTMVPRYSGYQTAWVFTIQADHPPPQEMHELPNSKSTPVT